MERRRREVKEKEYTSSLREEAERLNKVSFIVSRAFFNHSFTKYNNSIEN